MVAGSAAGGTILAKSKLLLCLYTVFFGNVIAAPAFFTNQPDRYTHVFFLCHRWIVLKSLLNNNIFLVCVDGNPSIHQLTESAQVESMTSQQNLQSRERESPPGTSEVPCRAIIEPGVGIEPTVSPLPRVCFTTKLSRHFGWSRLTRRAGLPLKPSGHIEIDC